MPGPHLQDQGDKCPSSQSQEVTSLLSQAEAELGPESRMSSCLSFSTTCASSPEPTRDKGRGHCICQVAFSKRHHRPPSPGWQRQLGYNLFLVWNLEGGCVPSSSCFGVLSLWAFLTISVSNCEVWSYRVIFRADGGSSPPSRIYRAEISVHKAEGRLTSFVMILLPIHVLRSKGRE